MELRIPLLLALFSILSYSSFAQCTDGTQAECTCLTAPVLCTIDQLDGFAFSMSNFQHPQDGPTPLCANGGGVPNNPTWFAFTAWCTSLTLRASFSNCNPRNGSIGVQIAIYGDCNFSQQVACNVAPADCNTADKILGMTGLILGNTYYFLVDGCLGSDCDVMIDVVGTCGSPTIDPWTLPISGNTNVCVGDTENYSVESLQGANLYHWYLDGLEIAQTPGTSNTITWATAGTFQLCVDASNDPCIPVSAAPPQLCTTIMVTEAEAGTIAITPSVLCPGEIASITASGFTMNPENSQVILITDASGVILEVIPGSSGTYTSPDCGNFSACSYNYITNQGPVPFVGQNSNSINCNTNCCDLECMPFSFEDTEDPTFPNGPADQTYTCFDLVPPMADLDWLDNCDGGGLVAGTENGTADLCSGGSLTRVWEYTDACNNRGRYRQTITIQPTPAPMFVNPPGNMTVSCDNIPASGSPLSYTNNGTGGCLISGSVMPVESGTADICGGAITYTWDFTDACGNNINHTQTITVDPAPPLTFLNPPADVVVNCDQIPTTAPDLTYTNGATGACLITGTVPAVQSGTGGVCGGNIRFDWTFTDQCGNTVSHTQRVRINPSPPPTFANPPANMTVNCDAIPTSGPSLTYSNGAAGSCLVSGTIAPVESGTADICGGAITYTWDFTDACGNNINHTQTITVDPVATPAFVNPPADLIIDCDAVPPAAPVLNYTNGGTGGCLIEGSITPVQSGNGNMCGGNIQYVWEFTDPCGNVISHTQRIRVNPAPAVAFINPPASITVTCDAIPTSAPPLNYTNNGVGGCLFEGSIVPVESGSADICGGAITYTWDYVDPCGNVINHTQTITVDPLPAATFINPPGDMDVTCDQVPASAPDLMYSNNASGACLVEGTVSPVQSGNGGLCGGNIRYVWEFTDQCGNLVSHTQRIRITPPPTVTFVNPPANMTVACDAIPTSAPTLNYTNNGTGACLFEGSIVPVESGSADICGGAITYTWDFVDPCGNAINHTQTITVDPAPAATFINPPGDMQVNCDQVPNSAPDLMYSNNASGVCLIEGTVSPVEMGNGGLCGGNLRYVWEFTDQCGNLVSHTQRVRITPPPAVTFVNPPANMTVTCDAIPTSAPTLNYTNNGTGACLFEGSIVPVESGSADICGGVINYIWDFVDPCGNVINHTQTITVDPAPAPTFINPPGDMQVNCDQVPNSAPDLMYSNNASGVCLIEGTVSPVQMGNGNFCGGNIRYVWEFVDQCGNVVSHIQRVRVTPPPPVAFLNPPANMTVSCDAIPTSAPTLNYTNNGTGACLFEGSIVPVESGSADICGGVINYIWDFVDPCGNVINHTQTITVDPAPAPTFINPPGDMQVNCDQVPNSAPDLMYSNNASGVCLIEGTVSPVQMGNGNLCGGNIRYVWEFVDQCGNVVSHIQRIRVTPPAPVAFLNLPADMTVACDNIPTSAPLLDYTNNGVGACLFEGQAIPIESGNGNLCGGVISYTWDVIDPCGNAISHTQNITIDPAPVPAFLSPPADLNVSCNNIPSNPPSLTYSNNGFGPCLIEGTVQPVISGNPSTCGGSIIYTWNFTDNCGRPIQHQQTINIDPPSPPIFSTLPGPQIINCADVLANPPVLNYSNGENGLCAINGTVPVIQSGFYDACGGTITYTWIFTDDCSRTISHDQEITVLPAPDPVFTSFPPDLLIGCGEPFPPSFILEYTNNELGDCGINGVATAIETITSTGISYTWTFVNPCNSQTVSHTQEISRDEEPDIIIAPSSIVICEGDNFDLSTVTVTDLNSTNPNITFHAFSPAVPGNQIPAASVSPTITTTFYILATNSGGCTDEASLTLDVEPAPFAGIDGSGVVCFSNASTVNLFDFLTGVTDFSGQWSDPTSSGVDVSNPFNVDLSSFPSGGYLFDYSISSTGICPDDQASAVIELRPEIELNLMEIECSADLSSYQIIINDAGWTYDVSGGTLTPIGSNQLAITDIPIGQTLTIRATDPLYPNCAEQLSISPPNCNCPTVNPPISSGDESICENEMIPVLSVTVGVDETANWYDAASGGMLLLGGSTTYTPMLTTPGLYSFYVEAENLTNACISSIRTLVQLEIFANPTGNNAALETCDDDEDGMVTFDLSTAAAQINANPGINFTFYPNLADAQNGANALSTIYNSIAIPTETLYAVIANANGCSDIVELNLTIQTLPSLTLDIINEDCLGSGNGSVTVNAPDGIRYSLDGSTWVGGSFFDNLPSGSYTVFVEGTNTCIAEQDFIIEGGITLSVASFDLVCDDNGTSSDATDDFYTISFMVSSSAGTSGNYTVMNGSTGLGTFPYDAVQNLTFPANGQSFSLLFTDENFPCSVNQPVGPLTSCSTDCEISLDELTYNCDDNGTSTDPSDDFYVISINASAINGAANNTYNVLVDGTLSYNFPYGVSSTFNLDATATSPIITVVDNQDALCLVSQSIGPLTPCSDACLASIESIDFLCNDNGTITDPSDDFYSISIQASALNPGPSMNFEVYIDNVLQGAYSYAAGANFDIPASGATVLVRIQDADDAGCTAEQTLGPLEPCDEECRMNASVSNILCDDNGTGSDPSDDLYTFGLIVTGQNIGSAWQSSNGQLSGTYGQLQTFGPYPIAGGGTLSLNLEDDLTAGCFTPIQVIPPLSCSDDCEISFDGLDFTCDDNGTITNPSDDFYEIRVRATALNPSASGSFEVYVDNVLQGTYFYTSGATFNLPANGTTAVVRIQDVDDPNCNEEQSLGPLEPCDEECRINASVSGVICDDNGTPTDPSDDLYTFNLLVTGQNTGGTWQNSTGQFSGSYGQVETFGPFPISGGGFSLELTDIITSTCMAMAEITAPATCSGDCDISLSSFSSNCNDNGTLTDPSDDFYEISLEALAVNPGPSGLFEVYVDNVLQNNYAYTNTATFTLPANSTTVVIRIQDQDNASCFAVQTLGPLEPCDEECQINAVVSNIICDDNGTGVDPTDDLYSFDILVTGQNTGASWQSTNGQLSGTYGQVQTYGPYPISGGGFNLILEDDITNGCTAALQVTPPPTCSGDCEISFNQVLFDCDDNGTITDPSDDFYAFTITASALNAGASGNFEVYVDNVLQGTYTYISGASFNLPANGATIAVRIQDADDAACTAEQILGPLDPCDEECRINASVSNILCDNNGTGTDPTDDFFTFDLLVTGQNTGASWQSSNGQISGTYGQTQSYGPFPISGGGLSLSLEDAITVGCIADIQVDPPATCSDDCEIRFDRLSFDCNDNGTITDPTDDFYALVINASALNPSPSGNFEVYIDNVLQGTYAYVSGASFNLPANGITVLVRIQDVDDAGCTAEQTLGPLDPCDEECRINVSVSNIICDDNGTGDDASDDTFTFDLLVTGQNTGGTWTSTTGLLSGSYGVVQNYGPFQIAEGLLNLDLEDGVTPGCIANIQVTPPVPCSSCPQSLDAGTAVMLTCDDTNVLLSAVSSEAGQFDWTGPNAFTATGLMTSVVDSGWYVLTALFPDGCMLVDSVLVEMNREVPQVNAGPDQFLSCTIEEIELNAALGNPPGLDYEWTAADGSVLSSGAILNVDSAGVYYLQITDPTNGCPSLLDEIIIADSTALPSAIIYADPGNVLDCQIGTVLLFTDEQANVVYFWNSVLSDDIRIFTAGTVNLIALDTITGCENQDNIVITDLSDYPIINLDPVDTLSCYTSQVLIDGSASQSGVDIIYNWYDGAGNLIVGEHSDTLSILTGGFYIFEVADTLNGCENRDTIFVESLLDQVPLALVDQISALNCYNPSLVLDGSGSIPFGNLSYQWSTTNGNIISGANTSNPEVDAAGSYELTVVNLLSGCEHDTTIMITEAFDKPDVVIIQPGFINCYSPTAQIDASNSSTVGNFVYSWTSNPPGGISAGDSTLTPSISQGGDYTLTILNLDNGCSDSSTLTINADLQEPLASAVVEDELDCIIEEVGLNGEGSAIGPQISYLWTGPGLVGSTVDLEATANTAGIYTFSVTDSGNGCVAEVEVEVLASQSMPQGLAAEVTPPECAGDAGSIEILAVDGGEGPFLYALFGTSNFQSSPVFAPLLPGDYEIRVQDINGCEYIEILTVPAVPELTIDLDPTLWLELGEEGQLIASISIPLSDIDTIIWSPGDSLSCTNCLTPTVNIVNETLYKLLVIDLNGCEAEDEILVQVKKDKGVYIPNAFTPGNDDGTNDVFMVFGNNDIIKEVNSFQIFDRWGEKVFEDYNFQPNDPSHGWDGTLKGQDLNPAVFVYWAKIEFIDGEVRLFEGDVTLLK